MRKPTFRIPKERAIVFYCNGMVPHGGMVDRLKGMISCYELARLEGLDFRISYTSPLDLTRFFEPGKHDWRQPEEGFNPFYSAICYHMDDFNVDIRNVVRSKRTRRFCFFYNINALPQLYPALDKESLEAKWRHAFHTLFVPTNTLSIRLASVKEPYICCHTRFTSLMGDFRDTTNTVLTDTEKDALVSQVTRMIEEIQSQNQLPVYVLSDSERFLAHCETLPGIRVLPGKPGHVGVAGATDPNEVFMKTWTDFDFLSKAESVYLLIGNRMYNSDFSRYAALMGHAGFNVVKPKAP
ncbi:MAG TPA: hypothetical protein VK183_01570 [Flavobacterium sp.]|nr:hypothetical protein [Flavobacterium sp.]